MAECQGSFRALVLYDVAEQIRLEELQRILGVEPGGREPSFVRPAPDYVRFERPPVVEPWGPVHLRTGHQFHGRLKYYDYGVVSVELEYHFSLQWTELVRLSASWIAAEEIEDLAFGIVRAHLKSVAPALVKEATQWLSEDYYVVHLREAKEHPEDRPLTAAELLARRGHEIAQLVRGEVQPLSDMERAEVLRSVVSYYPSDLLVVGWVSAFIYDSVQGAAPTIQLLEYANTQLVEFRHYDEVLTRVLSSVYQSLERRSGFLSRWRLAREAALLNTLRLDITELAERTDNAIKFLSDMFYARVYRLAADRVGVSDYRRLVEDKLRTAGELYQFMMNEFHQGRAFVLELMIVLILIVDLYYLFFGAK